MEYRSIERSLDLDDDPTHLREKVADILRVPSAQIASIRIMKRSVGARRSRPQRLIYETSVVVADVQSLPESAAMPWGDTAAMLPWDTAASSDKGRIPY
jgi:hypothetical protein